MVFTFVFCLLVYLLHSLLCCHLYTNSFHSMNKMIWLWSPDGILIVVVVWFNIRRWCPNCFCAYMDPIWMDRSMRLLCLDICYSAKVRLVDDVWCRLRYKDIYTVWWFEVLWLSYEHQENQHCDTISYLGRKYYACSWLYISLIQGWMWGCGLSSCLMHFCYG